LIERLTGRFCFPASPPFRGSRCWDWAVGAGCIIPPPSGMSISILRWQSP